MSGTGSYAICTGTRDDGSGGQCALNLAGDDCCSDVVGNEDAQGNLCYGTALGGRPGYGCTYHPEGALYGPGSPARCDFIEGKDIPVPYGLINQNQ